MSTARHYVFIKQLGSPCNNRFWFPSEPSFIPKLQLQLAEFPELPHLNGHRLLTSETWCGHRYAYLSQITIASWINQTADGANESALCLSCIHNPQLTCFLGYKICHLGKKSLITVSDRRRLLNCVTTRLLVVTEYQPYSLFHIIVIRTD